MIDARFPVSVVDGSFSNGRMVVEVGHPLVYHHHSSAIHHRDRSGCLCRCNPMANKAYIVRFRPPALSVAQPVIASTVEIHDEHLIFCDSEGKLAALFLLKIVESWSGFQMPDPSCRRFDSFTTAPCDCVKAKCLKSRAVSMGGCNTGLEFTSGSFKA